MKRYDMYAGDGRELIIDEDPEGEWVRYEDVKGRIELRKISTEIAMSLHQRFFADAVTLRFKQGENDYLIVDVDRDAFAEFIRTAKEDLGTKNASKRGLIPSRPFDKKDIRSVGVGIGISDEGVFPLINLCRDCTKIRKPAGAMYEPHPDSICMDSRAGYREHVTGAVRQSKCSEINVGGLCGWFVASLEGL